MKVIPAAAQSNEELLKELRALQERVRRRPGDHKDLARLELATDC